MKLNRVLQDRKLVVCCGSGGVGKTTTSAAIALHAAQSGKKTMVITIDPARRLAQSLGLEGLTNEERQVPMDRFVDAGVEVKGSLWAAMLDTKASLDSLIRRIARDEKQEKQITDTMIYRQFTNAIAGSQEYVAMERLYELMQQRDYDLVVLDTPPTKNALDFLNAPSRLASFLDENVVKWFTQPAKKSMRSLLFHKGGEVVFKLLGLLVGDKFIQDLTNFFQAMTGLTEGFAERARKVNELLRNSSTVFVLVTSAEQNALSEALYFHNKLVEADIPLEAVIVNRAFELSEKLVPKPEELATLFDGESIKQVVESEPGMQQSLPGLVDKLAGLKQVAEQLNSIARENVERLDKALGGGEKIACVPIFNEDIHDIRGLLRMGNYLFAQTSVCG